MRTHLRVPFVLSLVALACACTVRDCPDPVYYEPAPAPAPPPVTEPAPSGGDGSGVVCGTRGAAACASNEYCDFPDGTECGALDQGGTCRARPEACTMEHSPVCGCDGQTYPNACAAYRAGADVSSRGACGTAGLAPCVPGGCSNQLCVEQGEDAISTCEWRPEHACYRSASCERQPNGQCGWTPTPALQQCLANPPAQ